jgi:two-component system response regulator RegA
MAGEQGGRQGLGVGPTDTVAAGHREAESVESPTLLIVDDDDNLRIRVMRAMMARGYLARDAATGAAALSLAEREPMDFAVVDLRLPDMTGLDVVRGLKAISPQTRVVVLTGYGSIATALEAMRLGADEYLAKPVDADDVTRALAGETGLSEPAPTVPSLARVEWEHINRVLLDCEGNISATARALGIHRRSLQRKLAKFPTFR